MSDKPSNHAPGDELLSAYLDGELSADERAAVEARLATDPAAQQLLHELRSVSQSVQALPTESLGRDLSEEIVRRARETAPISGRSPSAKLADATEPSRLGDTIPKIRIFNSRRAWIWASMALAVGLLIMIVQSGDESAKKPANRRDAKFRCPLHPNQHLPRPRLSPPIASFITESMRLAPRRPQPSHPAKLAADE
jgi:anti-sigma factor RsiW